MWLLFVAICAGYVSSSCNYVNTGHVYDNWESCVFVGQAAQNADGKANITNYRCIKVTQ